MVILALCLSACKSDIAKPEKASALDYTNADNWAYFEVAESARADVFFICPTVFRGDASRPNMLLENEKTKARFVGEINKEKGIYDGKTRFFAPYYRQVGLWVYTLAEEEREKYLSIGYSDIKAAFETYLEQYNDGKPFIIAGFSQGAELSIRLVKDYCSDESVLERMIACYAIGWRLTHEDLDNYPYLVAAQGEDDIGVVISFNTEDPSITDSTLVPNGITAIAINPISWQTNSVPVDKSLNKGACFTNHKGDIVSEIPMFTGAFLDEKRGTLKVTDVSPVDYPPVLDMFTNGVYHIYDYQFFYRNLQENVQTRIDRYLSESEK